MAQRWEKRKRPAKRSASSGNPRLLALFAVVRAKGFLCRVPFGSRPAFPQLPPQPRLAFPPKSFPFQTQPFRAVVHREEKQNAGKKVQAEWMHVTHTLAADKFIGKTPRSRNQ